MNINDTFPSKNLKAADLAGAEVIVTIDHVDFEPIGQQREMKAVVYFKGKQKGLVLNKTNGKKIAAIAGTEETDDWTGVKIRLYPTETEFQGDTVDCIRVKAVNGAKPAPVVPPPAVDDLTDDDIPF